MKWADSGGGDFEQAPAGTHVARCIRLIDIGTQFGEYQGKPNALRKVVVTWELPNELMTEGDFAGKPFLVNKWYTASLGEKANLRKDLVNWRGREFTDDELRGFESRKILGTTCMLSLTPNDKGKVRVTGVMKLPKGSEAPTQINPSVYFSLEKDEFKQATFDGLSEYWQTEIKKSPEWADLKGTGPVKGSTAKPSHFDDMADDIPF
ncbi:MAG: hypothetical protein M3R13_11965 [Armatimonadota bacterium]|nr:hypothetical protein [Armatimonadota bacterium]